MGHSICGFIAAHDLLVASAISVPGAYICRLKLGFGFMPLTDQIAPRENLASNLDGLYELTAPMQVWAAEQSHRFAIAYIETDFHGGTGSQAAVLWKNGAIEFGPIKTDVVYRQQTPPLLDWAINQTMRKLGIDRGSALDEFDALGLGLQRDNTDWIANGQRGLS